MINEDIEKGMEFDDEPVANLVRTLRRVDAPKDFEFGVRARIAKGNTQRDTGLVPTWVKAAVPLGLVLTAAAYFGVNALYSPSAPDVAAVTPGTSQPQVETPQPLQQQQPEQLIVTSQPPLPESIIAQAPKASTSRSSRPASRKTAADRANGGSVDSAVTEANTIDIRERSVTEAFSEIGVSGTFEGSGLKVGSADFNRSGIKPGDIIESVNGKSVSANSTVKGRIGGKTLRIRRGSTTFEVRMKN